MKRMLQHFGIMASIALGLSSAQKARNEGIRTASDRTIEKSYFKVYGPGRNQRKRRKLVRQGAHKWAKRRVK